ncbi:Uncharacterized protein dnl_37410 [Desulfonema limicola]|uniref:Uncharacterized protein n=1 Tax=Desulfonema limicola TaxID=45656 RepID=A0A975B9I1_9BACT|nr:hypothetical protein [Desulfonema limicola]QTA81406.1 Uncharacterized protein dnl_37410 [Desulfonema limicola]
MKDQTPSKILFTVDKKYLSIFFPVLQQGFKVSARFGCSLKSMLCDQFGITPEYLSDRIKTIFLNGKPVDDPETAIIYDNAVLALSAAMPGLVGATFRSQGPLSIFRSSITHRNKEEKSEIPGKGMLTLKFFNLLVPEMGPAFLERGIWLKTGIIKNLIEEKKADLDTFFKSIIINGQKTGADELTSLKWNDNMELIQVAVKTGKEISPEL